MAHSYWITACRQATVPRGPPGPEMTLTGSSTRPKLNPSPTRARIREHGPEPRNTEKRERLLGIDEFNHDGDRIDDEQVSSWETPPEFSGPGENEPSVTHAETNNHFVAAENVPAAHDKSGQDP